MIIAISLWRVIEQITAIQTRPYAEYLGAAGAIAHTHQQRYTHTSTVICPLTVLTDVAVEKKFKLRMFNIDYYIT